MLVGQMMSSLQITFSEPLNQRITYKSIMVPQHIPGVLAGGQQKPKFVNEIPLSFSPTTPMKIHDSLVGNHMGGGSMIQRTFHRLTNVVDSTSDT